MKKRRKLFMTESFDFLCVECIKKLILRQLIVQFHLISVSFISVNFSTFQLPFQWTKWFLILGSDSTTPFVTSEIYQILFIRTLFLQAQEQFLSYFFCVIIFEEFFVEARDFPNLLFIRIRILLSLSEKNEIKLMLICRNKRTLSDNKILYL